MTFQVVNKPLNKKKVFFSSLASLLLTCDTQKNVHYNCMGALFCSLQSNGALYFATTIQENSDIFSAFHIVVDLLYTKGQSTELSQG